VTIRVDPEGNETSALFALVDLGGKQVLEIGSGDGRLTWRFAGLAAHVTAVEPFAPSVARAKRDLPDELKDRLEFHQADFGDFALTLGPGAFDVVLLSWSLC
jgi:16S rRNA A1518/A1519 N6-dimethyltransferase RsmA/KsgA/DIM1 with predicted DNA glycosylase/AP lyase activity